jgi:hypothetical protein
MSERPKHLDITMEMVCEIPHGKYGKIVGIAVWHDEIFVTTEYGGLLRLIVREDNLVDYTEVAPCEKTK